MESRSRRFTVASLRGVSLRVIHWGSESLPTLVLLHGGGANAHWWDHLAPALAAEFHVAALDFRGHGDSDYPEEVAAGAFSEDLDALLEALDCPDPILIGHSMGARIALDRAANDDRVRALALLDPAWRVRASIGTRARRVLASHPTYRSRETAVERFQFLPEARPEESLRRAIAERSVRRLPNGRFGFKFDPRWFSLPQTKHPPLERVACETLVVRGAESSLLSADAARDFVSRLARGRLIEVDRAGHHVQIDRPAEVLAALQEFLRSVRYTAGGCAARASPD